MFLLERPDCCCGELVQPVRAAVAVLRVRALMATRSQTPAAAARQVEALTNPMLAGFVLAEVREHIARTEAEAGGSLLVAPRVNLLRQLCHQVEQLHGLDQPTPTRAPGPPDDHTPGGP